MASNTGCTSVPDRLIIRSRSPVAVCRSSAVVSSRFLASSSVNSRTFSIAITAWSANVSRSLIWVSENGRASVRLIVMAPIATPSRSSGTLRTARMPSRLIVAATSGN